jgi:hypothetical protein
MMSQTISGIADRVRKEFAPKVKPRAGEKKRVPKAANAPGTGKAADISPLIELSSAP